MNIGDCEFCNGTGERVVDHVHGIHCELTCLADRGEIVDCDECDGTGCAAWTPELAKEAWGSPDWASKCEEHWCQFIRSVALNQTEAACIRPVARILMGIDE